MLASAALALCHLVLLTQQVATGKECGQPGEPAHGRLVSTEILFYPGEEVTYSCHTGYVLAGRDRRVCGEDGTWSGALPSCKENLAVGRAATQSDVLWSYGPELAVDGDPNTCSFTTRQEGQRWWQVQLQNHPIVERVWVTMSPGAYQKFAIFVVEILDGNTAEYKPCAQFEGRFHEQLVRFECNEGRGQLGQFVYIRDDRVDREYFGLCEVQVFEKAETPNCGQPEVPVYSQVTPLGAGSVEYTCTQGYTRLGPATRNCTELGWVGPVPQCKEVKCDHPTSTKDGFIEVSNFRGSYVYGSRATYHCNPGYILWGNSTRLCDSSGEWTGSAPQCRLISCGDPPMLPHSAVTLLNGSTVWRAQATYSCLPGHDDGAEGLGRAESVCQESGHWSRVRLVCGGSVLTGGGSGSLAPGNSNTNVFYVSGTPGEGNTGSGVSSATLTIIGILAAVILGTAVLSTAILVKKWLTKHVYYPAGANVTAEKPLIYDKVDSLGGAGDLTYQTTALSTFKQTQVDTSSSSADSSCSALCPPTDSHCHTVQTMLNAGYDPTRRVLNTYSSLPRPSHLIGWSYADQSEVTSHALLSRRAPEGGPEYANLLPWARADQGRHHPPAPPPRAVHYATLARAPHSKRGLAIRPQCQNSSEKNELEVSDSIPDILQTLSSVSSTKIKKANVFVNELSDIEADLLDLNSPNQDLQVQNDGDILEKSETNGL